MTIRSITIQEAWNFGVRLQAPVELKETTPRSLQERIAVKEVLNALAEFQTAKKNNIDNQYNCSLDSEIVTQAAARYNTALSELLATYKKTGITVLR